MAQNLWQEFYGDHSSKLRSTRDHEPNRPLNRTVGDEPLSHEEKRGAVSKAALEHKEAAHDPIVAQPRGEHAAPVRGIDLDEEDLVSQITIWRNTPTLHN